MICEDILTMKFLEDLHLFDSTKLNGFKYCYVTVTIWYPYLPNTPLGRDMTQGQFLSGV